MVGLLVWSRVDVTYSGKDSSLLRRGRRKVLWYRPQEIKNPYFTFIAFENSALERNLK
jgi:hypothetical protein